MSELADIVAELDRLDRERAELMDRLRVAALARKAEPEVEVSDAPFTDRLRPCQAEKIFEVSRSYLHKHAVAQLGVPGGFSSREESGRYWYSRSLLALFLQRNPPRRRASK